MGNIFSFVKEITLVFSAGKIGKQDVHDAKKSDR